VIDANLNVSVKRVLLPTDMAAISGTVSTVSGSVTVTGSGTAFSTTATTSDTVIGPGDTVLVGDETVRQVISVGSATQLTVNKPFTVDAGGATLSKVIVANGSASNCPTCVAAEMVIIASGTGATFFGLASVPIKDSGSAGNPMSLASRFSANTDTVINTNDVFLSDASGNTSSPTTVLTFVTRSTGRIDVNNTQANRVVYALYHGSDRNDTGTAVKVTSQTDPTGIVVALNETGPVTGVFRVNIVVRHQPPTAPPTLPNFKLAHPTSLLSRTRTRARLPWRPRPYN